MTIIIIKEIIIIIIKEIIIIIIKEIIRKIIILKKKTKFIILCCRWPLNSIGFKLRTSSVLHLIVLK